MSAISMHTAPAIRNTTIAKGIHDLVDRLGVLAEVLPKVGRIITAAKMARGVSLLGVDQVRKLGRISNEKDGRVVLNKIPVALLGAKLDREASRISSMVVRAAFATNS